MRCPRANVTMEEQQEYAYYLLSVVRLLNVVASKFLWAEHLRG